MPKFMIRADASEGYETARKYREAVQAYGILSREQGRVFNSMDEVDAYLTAMGTKRESDTAYGTDADSEFAARNGQVRVGMVTFVLAANNMRMGNGYKVIKVRGA